MLPIKEGSRFGLDQRRRISAHFGNFERLNVSEMTVYRDIKPLVETGRSSRPQAELR
ncbi:HTH domain-containing protein [Bacillus licheniformis]|nr:HTH domain-containing protein [Bacillus licheniformis]